MIYFVECIGANAIKIGACRGPMALVHARISTMQSNCPLPLDLLAAADGYKEDERGLHRRFPDDWIRGDWFHATDDLRAFVAEFPRPPLPPRRGDARYNRRPAKAREAA